MLSMFQRGNGAKFIFCIVFVVKIKQFHSLQATVTWTEKYPASISCLSINCFLLKEKCCDKFPGKTIRCPLPIVYRSLSSFSGFSYFRDMT